MSYQMILYEKNDGVATITLNRPESLNAIDIAMRDEIIDAVKDADSDSEIRVVIITGGTKVFCAGADIKNPPTPRTTWDRVSSRRNYSYFTLIEDMGKPVIAAIAGYCLGGGMELACTCDIRIAADNAKLGDAHSKVGLIGGAGSTQKLPRLIGVGKAKELIFSGEPISGVEAERIGLVNRVVPTELLLDEARKLADCYKARPPILLKLVKSAINNGVQMGMVQALDYEALCATIQSMTKDAKEGTNAFIEKRSPIFKGV